MHGSDALADVVKSCTAASDLRTLFETALPKIRRLLRASTVVVEQHGPDGIAIAFCDGLEVPAAGVAVAADGTRQVVLDPDPWHLLGINHVVSQRLAGHAGVLALGWPTSADVTPVAPQVGVVLDLVAYAAGRLAVESDFHDLTVRVGSAQHLASMGDYDWHIASDTNTWSDELYRIYGYEPQSFNASYERFLANIHPDDRERVQTIHQEAYATGEPYGMIERIVRPDGEVRYLSSNGEVIMDASGTPVRMRGTCIDITERVLAEQEREALAIKVGESQQRRRQALEINDNVVQGLSAASYALDQGDLDIATSFVRRTLASARHMMDDLLEPQGHTLGPGDLIRAAAASLDPNSVVEDDPEPTGEQPELSPSRVLIVDDAEDIRMLLRLKLGRHGDYDVVGEAADGQDAVQMARALQPDLVLLDMAMPRMDGLQALPLIREAVPDVRVIVLSGFNQGTLEKEAVAAGADRYVVKGGSMQDLLDLIADVLAAA